MRIKPPNIPSKIIAAMDFIRFCDSVQSGYSAPVSPFDPPGQGTGGRKLTKMENEVYESALTCVLAYFEDVDFSQLIEMEEKEPPSDEQPPQTPANVF